MDATITVASKYVNLMIQAVLKHLGKRGSMFSHFAANIVMDVEGRCLYVGEAGTGNVHAIVVLAETDVARKARASFLRFVFPDDLNGAR